MHSLTCRSAPRTRNEGLVVGTKAGDAQAPPRVGPLWIFEGRYTAGRVPGWQTAWGSNGSSHRGRDGHPDSRRVRGWYIPLEESAREGRRGRSYLGVLGFDLGPIPSRTRERPMAAKMEHVSSVVAERWIINGIARSRAIESACTLYILLVHRVQFRREKKGALSLR